MFKKILVGLFIPVCLSFAYGVVVGHYKVFPYDQIQSVKATIATGTGMKNPVTLHPSYLSNTQLFNGLSKDYDIVFLGDSITNGGRWSEAFITKKVANRGIGGDTSKGILHRIDQVLDMNPKSVYIMLGINDIAGGLKADDVFYNYKEIVRTLTEKNIEVIIQSTLLSDKEKWNIEVNKLNGYLIELSKNNNYRYIDINEVLAPSGVLTSEVSFDGVHLKPEMYLKWFNLIDIK